MTTTKKSFFGSLSDLHVIVPISNPIRYKTRYLLARQFFDRLNEHGVNYTAVEIQQGDRPHEFEFPEAINYKTFSEIWHKENATNLVIRYLRHRPERTDYVAWVDADLIFNNPYWVEETVQQLQHYKIVQMFSHAIDYGPNLEPMRIHVGFIYSHLTGRAAGIRYQDWHPGFAWAARMETLEEMGDLIDKAILGSADRHMATSLIGQAAGSFGNYGEKLHPNYINMVMDWQRKADHYIGIDNIGYVPGTVGHYWHGNKKNRQYGTRWKILAGIDDDGVQDLDNQYDPFLDVRYDDQGLLYLSSRKPQLRRAILNYFISRDEDATA